MNTDQLHLNIDATRIKAQEALRKAVAEKIGAQAALFVFTFCATSAVVLSIADALGSAARSASAEAMANLYAFGVACTEIEPEFQRPLLQISMNGITKTNDAIRAWSDKLRDAGASGADVEKLSQEEQMYAFINKHLDLSGEIAQIQGL